jgi:hypothetical protein
MLLLGRHCINNQQHQLFFVITTILLSLFPLSSCIDIAARNHQSFERRHQFSLPYLSSHYDDDDIIGRSNSNYFFKGFPLHPEGQTTDDGNSTRDKPRQLTSFVTASTESLSGRGFFATVTLTMATSWSTYYTTTTTTCTTSTAAIKVCSPSKGRRRRADNNIIDSSIYRLLFDEEEEESVAATAEFDYENSEIFVHPRSNDR